MPADADAAAPSEERVDGVPEGLLDELLRVALDVAAAGAEVLAGGRGRTRTTVETKSTGTDMVTEIDRASEAAVVGRLREVRPGDGVVGEEGTSTASTTGVRWIVDPLDGTTNYLYDFPSFAVSVGAEVDGRPSVGVVVDVAHGEIFSAVAGRGANLDGRPLVLGPVAALDRALVGTGFAYDPAVRVRQGAVVAHVVPHVRDLRRAGAASVDLCWVAAGRLDAYYERGLAPWDHAAGGVIATEAGATVSTLHGGPAADDVLVCAPQPLHDELRTLLLEAGAT